MTPTGPHPLAWFFGQVPSALQGVGTPPGSKASAPRPTLTATAPRPR